MRSKESGTAGAGYAVPLWGALEITYGELEYWSNGVAPFWILDFGFRIKIKYKFKNIIVDEANSAIRILKSQIE